MEEKFHPKIFPKEKEKQYQNEKYLLNYLGKHHQKNIIQYYDYQDKELLIKLEKCNGGSLENLKVPLTENEVKEIITQILNGLHFLHSTKNIIHCDIKPGNILIKYPNDQIRNLNQATFVIADFDCSKKTDKYTQLTESEKEEKRDTYSVGCVMYYLLTGKPYYDTTKKKYNKTISKNSKISKECLILLTGLLKNNSENRYNTDQAMKSYFILRNFNTFTPFNFNSTELNISKEKSDEYNSSNNNNNKKPDEYILPVGNGRLFKPEDLSMTEYKSVHLSNGEFINTRAINLVEYYN